MAANRHSDRSDGLSVSIRLEPALRATPVDQLLARQIRQAAVSRYTEPPQRPRVIEEGHAVRIQLLPVRGIEQIAAEPVPGCGH